jgi:hypothetical protein
MIKEVYLKHQDKRNLIYRLDKVYNEVSPLIKDEKVISFITDDADINMLLKSNYIFAPILLDRKAGQRITLVLREDPSKLPADTLFNQHCILNKHIEGFSVKLYTKRND